MEKVKDGAWHELYSPSRPTKVIKKDGSKVDFNIDKVIVAVGKSAYRALTKLTEEDMHTLCKEMLLQVDSYESDEIPIIAIHSMVEMSLDKIKPIVAKSYKDYRDYKRDFIAIMDDVYKKSQSIMYIGDKENANTDSALVSTKRSLIFNQLNKEMYQKFFMNTEELQACRDGYIYVHDMSARRDTMNCFSRDTRFITDSGVRSFYDFKDGDEIIVLTHKGNWKKAVVKSYGHQKLQTVKFKRANGELKEVKCTENHRWILKDGSETINLSVGDKLISAPVVSEIDWNNMTKQDKLLWCLGFGIADGSIVEDNSIPTMTIRLCGHKIEFSKRFEDCGYTVSYPKSLNGDGIVRMIDIHSKNVPWLILNHLNVKYFVDGWLSADGNVGLYKSSKYRGLQVTGDANDYIFDLLNMSGYYVTNISDLTGQETNYGIRKSKTISYGFHSNQNDRTWVVDSIEDAYINGNAQVWCLEVEDDHSFILENGIPTGNCCLFDVASVLEGGFEMGNIWYNEPTTLDVAGDVIGDIVLSAASQQYGGFTVPEVDKLLVKYAKKSFDKYVDKYMNKCKMTKEAAEELAWEDVSKEMEQVFQGWEYKFNTVASSRGDYPSIVKAA